MQYMVCYYLMPLTGTKTYPVSWQWRRVYQALHFKPAPDVTLNDLPHRQGVVVLVSPVQQLLRP